MYEVLIVGAGVVGLTQALLLAENQNWRIALVDSKKPESTWSKSVYDARVYAITPGSQAILEKIGVWKDIQTQRLSPFKRMQVWDGQGRGEVFFDQAQLGLPVLGHIIEENLLRSSLLAALARTPNVEMLSPCALTQMQEGPDCLELQALSKPLLQARLLIGADGAHSWVRKQAGISLREQDYHHSSLIAQVETELPHQQTARQVFLSGPDFPSGPLAFLPLENPHHCSIVWSTKPEAAAALCELDERVFREQLRLAFDARLGEIRNVSQRQVFPLSERQAERYIKPRLALIGDAAHTLHPLAGQGVNLGLADAAALAELIFSAARKNRDYTSLSALRPYERARKSENAVMLTTVKLLKSLFESEKKSLSLIRNQGLKAINELSWLKHFFARYAMSF